MHLIVDLKELSENIKTFDGYLASGGSNKEFALDLISRGKCFVVVNKNDETKFYPSKFIGYKNNDVYKYSPNQMDGRDTNSALNKILGCTCQKDIMMTERFIAYCEAIGLKGSEKKKFWLNELSAEELNKSSNLMVR